MTNVRYGIVGAGYFGAELARALERIDGAQTTLVYDVEGAYARDLADGVGARVANTVAELCASDDVDAVIVASPNWAHKEAVLLAAQHGKDVFCEKPIALSYADCAEMVEATTAASVRFMAGHITNFMTGVRRAKRWIADGAIGDLIYVRALRNGWEEPVTGDEVSWKKQRDLSGGHLFHHIHELDLVQSIMGPAKTVTMVGGNVAHSGPGFGDEDDLLLITLEFGENRFATLEYGSAFRWPEHSVLIQGTLGAILLDLQDTKVVLSTPDGREQSLLHKTSEEDADRTRIYHGRSGDGPVMYGGPGTRAPQWLNGIIADELEYFHALQTGAVPAPEFAALTDGSAATAAIATADALTRSLAEGRKVDVAEIRG